MNREMGAVGSPMSKPGFNSLTGLSGAPISRPARVGPAGWAGGYCGRGGISRHETAAVVTPPGWNENKGFKARPGVSHLVQGQAGQPGGNSEPRELRGFPVPVGGGE